MRLKRIVTVILVFTVLASMWCGCSIATTADNNSADTVYFETLQSTGYDRYTGNEGDSNIRPIDSSHGYDTFGNTYLHGLDIWVARWNFENESSWVWRNYTLPAGYNLLKGTLAVANNCLNKTHFDTTVQIIGDGRVLFSQRLAPGFSPIDIDLNISGISTIQISAKDNTATYSGTDFLLGNLRLTQYSSSYRSNLAVSDRTFLVFQNTAGSSDINDNYLPCSDAEVKYNGANTTTDVNGLTMLNIPVGSVGTVVSSKSGYISDLFDSFSVADTNMVFLEKDDGGSLPVFTSVRLNSSEDDLRHTASAVYKSDGSFLLNVGINWRSGQPGSIWLQQGNTVIPLISGVNTVDMSTLAAGGGISICAQNAAGLTAVKNLKLTVGTTAPSLPGTVSTGIDDSFSLPSGIPVLGGRSYGFNIGDFGIVYEIEPDGEFHGVITAGLADGESKYKFDDKTYRLIKKACVNNDGRTFNQAYTLLQGMIPPKKITLFNDYDLKFAGYMDGYCDGNKSVITDSEFGFEGTGSSQMDFPVTFMPVPAFLELGVTGQIDAQFGIKAQNDNTLGLDGQGSASVTMNMGAGLGWPSVLSFSGGGEGGLQGKYERPSTTPFTLSERFDLYLKATLWGNEICKQTYHDSGWEQIYPKLSGTAKTLLSAGVPKAAYNTSNCKLISRSYINNPTYFYGNSKRTKAFANAWAKASYATTSTLFKSNVYPQSEPQMADLGNAKRLMVWLDDDRARTDINRTALFYSIYNGTEWSTPQQVQDDGTADFAPQLTATPSGACLVWQNVKSALDDSATVEEQAAAMDISYASFDTDTGSFTDIKPITNDTSLDMTPHVAALGDNVTVAWIQNPNDDIFGTKGQGKILSQTLSSGTWGNVNTVEQGLGQLDSIAVGYCGASCLYAYSVINGAQSSDLYVVTPDGNSNKVTSAAAQNLKPQFDANGELYWYADGDVDTLANAALSLAPVSLNLNAVLPDDRFKVLSSGAGTAIVFNQSNQLNSELYGYFYDTSASAWSNAVQLTSLGGSIQGFAGIMDNSGQLEFALNKCAVTGSITDNTDASPYGEADLCTVSITPETDIALSNVSYDPDELVPGSSLPIDFTVSNNGEKTVSAEQIDILDAQGNILSTSQQPVTIRPGQTKDMTEYYSLPANFTPSQIQLRVTPVGDNDAVPADNQQSITLNDINLSLESLSYADTADGRIIYARVVNRGLEDESNVTVKLTDGTANGTVLATQTIASLSAGSAITVTFNLEGTANLFQRNYYATVLPVQNEDDLSDNSAYILAAEEPTAKPFVSVTGISDIPTATVIGVPLTLTGTVNPASATNSIIAWSIKSDNGTGASIICNQLTAMSPGTVTVTATIKDGLAASDDYIQDIIITVSSPAPPIIPTPTPTPTRTDVNITGNKDPSTGATTSPVITSGDTNTSSVNDVIVKLDTVTITAPAEVLNNVLGGDSTGTLRLTQVPPAADVQAAAAAAAAANNAASLGIVEIDLTRYYPDGHSEAVQQLSGNITVTVALTAEQIAQLKSLGNPCLYSYDPQTNELTDVKEVFDLANGTATFSTNNLQTFVIAANETVNPVPTQSIGLSYNSHVQNTGWQKPVANGVVSGTTGKALRLEAIKISLTGDVPNGASIIYQTHVQNIGWQKPVADGAAAGTTGRSLRVEALKITLRGLEGYQVRYRVYVQGRGWMPWQVSKNGTSIDAAGIAGTTGKSLRAEAIQVVVEKIQK